MKHLSLLFCVILLSGCVLSGQKKVRHHRTTSLVEFLYPDGQIPNNMPRPVLNLPLRVGLAFIPEKNHRQAINPAMKSRLLAEVQKTFSNLPYVAHIEVIPDTYMQHRSNQQHFQQLAQIYQLDVMALVSYDQIINSKENVLALTYLTIVGSYIFPGSHFDVSTLIDLAVIDVNSKRLLFRAAGTHDSKGAAAEAYTPHQYDRHQNMHFEVAMQAMSDQLVLALAEFEQRLKNPTASDIEVKARPGYQMAFDWHLLLGLLLILIIRRGQVKTRKR